MHFQLKPESEYTNQGYLYLMEKSKSAVVEKEKKKKSSVVISIQLSSNRSLHSDMAKILLYLQEAKQTIHDAPVQSANTWTNCECI